MNTLQIRDAKASFSSLVAEAELGRPTLITRHGRPSAMVVPVDAGQRLFPLNKPTLADHLLSMPYVLETERDATPLRDIDL
jgi:antitoxin Phd